MPQPLAEGKSTSKNGDSSTQPPAEGTAIVTGGDDGDSNDDDSGSDVEVGKKRQSSNSENSSSKKLRLDSPTSTDEAANSGNGKGEDVPVQERITVDVCPPEGDYCVLANAIKLFFDNTREEIKYINEGENGNYDPKNAYGLHRRGIMEGWNKVFQKWPNLRSKMMETWASRPDFFLRKCERNSKVWGSCESIIFDDGKKRLGTLMKHTKFYHSSTNGKTKEMRGTFQVDLGGEEYVEGSENYGSAAKLFEDKEGNDDVDDNERIFDKLAAHVSAIKTVRALQYVEKIVDEQKKADADYELKYSAAKAANENRPPREANPVLEAKRNKIKSTDALCAKRVVVSSTLNCNCEARRVWVEGGDYVGIQCL